MSQFRVWAPRASSVELELHGRRVPMWPGAGAWWAVEVSHVGDQTDYAFCLDGGEPLPDPRSPWQPDGIRGRSRLLDHAAFRWSDAHWRAPPLSAGVIYELHVGTFTREGTFDAVIGRLGHLVDLGITHVELMPVASFAGARGWGYDGVSLYAPHEGYGGPTGLKRLVDACHARGLAVLLDVVYNHLGPSGNYLDRFGPYFTRRHATPWGAAVNLDDEDCDEVRRFLLDNAVMWLRDYHADGLRLDAVHALIDSSADHFLGQLTREVEDLGARLGRRLALIAESNLNDPQLVRSRAAGGYGFDAQWSDDIHHALHAALTGERAGYYADFGSLADVAKALMEGFVYDGRYSPYRGRAHGWPATGVPGHCFVGFLQNHDQVGNRARGERLARLVGVGRLKVGVALLLTSPFVPLLFQGEEWGAGAPFLYFTDHGDPGLASAVRDGRRKELAVFGWKPEESPDPEAAATFERCRLDWSEIGRPPHTELLEWYRRLLRLRRERPALCNGRMDRTSVSFDEHGRWLVLEREGAIVACNLASRHAQFRLPPGKLLLASEPGVRLAPQGVELPPDTVAILAAHDPSSPKRTAWGSCGHASRRNSVSASNQ